MEDLSHYNPEGSVMRKTQLRLLEILDVFDGICRKHHIDYWLDCGTLLGARRHGGFIPWDDDFDVCILHSDYKKLVSVLEKELPENLKLQTRETDKKYYYYFPRIRDTRSRLHNKRGAIFEYNGIFFDIFLIEPVPSIKFKKSMDNFLRSKILFKKTKSLHYKCKFAIMYCFLPLIHIIIKSLRVYYKYNKSSKHLYDRVYGLISCSTYHIEEILPVNEIMFEGKKYKAPRCIDKYLINQFGTSYMELPKASDRYSHASEVEFL